MTLKSFCGYCNVILATSTHQLMPASLSWTALLRGAGVLGGGQSSHTVETIRGQPLKEGK